MSNIVAYVDNESSQTVTFIANDVIIYLSENTELFSQHVDSDGRIFGLDTVDTFPSRVICYLN